jgi:superfamily II DNA/RNA helicase
VHRKDIIGAAETVRCFNKTRCMMGTFDEEYGLNVLMIDVQGSGKTLAFLLPIMHQILELREKYINKKYATREPQEVYGLILSPTRELAMQIVEHAKGIAKHAFIYIVPLVGGMAIQKQERLLSRKPHIIVATPGRLWEFLSQAHDAELDLSHLRYLILDEADKMVESGRFQELESILQAVYSARGAIGDFDGADLSENVKQITSSSESKSSFLPLLLLQPPSYPSVFCR